LQKRYVDISGMSLPPNKAQASIKAALLARVRDPQIAVVEALYVQPDVLAPIALDDLQAFTAALAEIVAQGDKAMLRQHLGFLIRSVGPRASPEVSQELFEATLFPCLLFSKDRHVGSVTWDVLADAAKAGAPGLVRYELLDGCLDAVESMRDSSKPPLAKMNIVIASCMAGVPSPIHAGCIQLTNHADTIIKSNTFEGHLSFLLKTASGAYHHPRALAHLVLRTLVGRMGQDQLVVAKRILDTVSVQSLQSLGEVSGEISAVGSFS
jgi:hypothetical protein